MNKFNSFSDIFEFGIKTKHRANDGLDNGKYPFFTSSGKQKKYLNEFDYKKESLIFATGGKASIHYCNDFFSTSADCIVAHVKDKKILTKYVYLYLYSNLQILEKGFRGAGLKHISKEYIKNIQIPILSLSEQKHIVEILDRVAVLLQKRKQVIELLDKYLKATFLDMFGDPVSNPKEWVKRKLEEIAEKNKNSIKAGPFGSSLKKDCYVEKGYKIYGQEQVIRDDLNYGNYFIDENKYKQLENCKIKEGDILISLVGSFGKISLVPKIYSPGIINPRLMKISVDKDIIIPIFLKYLLLTEEMKKKIESVSHGGTMDIVNVGIMKNISIIVPDIKYQKIFINILESINLIKQRMLASQKELDNLFNCLMQKAFNGELEKVEDNKLEIESKEKVNQFFYIQIIGAIIDNLNKEELKQGEMVIAKYLYLLDHLFKIKTKLNFTKGNFGPYDRQIKISLNNKMYFKKEGRTGFEYFSLTDKKNKLFEKKYKETREIENNIPEILKYFKKCDYKTRSHKVELLATIGKIMEDSKSTDFNLIWNEMKKWGITRDNFKNKSEIFTEEETKKCFEFILKNRWEENFIIN